MSTLTRTQLVSQLAALGYFEAAKTGTFDNMLVDPEAAIATKTEIAALTAIATADAVDPATTQALANECKAKINAIIAALKA
jgi:hypothetical protein